MKYRKVKIHPGTNDGYIKEGVFHQWGTHVNYHESPPVTESIAIVEEDGQIATYSPYRIEFIDEFPDQLGAYLNDPVKVINVKKEGVLFFRVEGRLTGQQYKSTKASVDALFGDGVKTVILEQGMSIEAYVEKEDGS